MTALLLYLLITVKAIKFEIVSLSDSKILGLLSKTLAACHKYSLPNREAGNSDGIISKKENFFSIFPCNF